MLISNAKSMSNVKVFDINTEGTDYICGDVHGMFDLLEAALAAVDFDVQTDRLFALGDLIDRGPQSKASIEYLKKPWFHSILGNHEQMALIAMTSRDRNIWGNWIINGGDWIIDVNEAQWPSYTEPYMSMPLVIELPLANGQVVGLVHAEMPLLDWSQFKSMVASWPEDLLTDPRSIKSRDFGELYDMLWGRERYFKGAPVYIDGIDHVFHGHTIVKDIKTMGNVSYIDTGSHLSNRLTVLNPQTFLSEREG